jgi:hypothetical protein
MTAPPLKSGPTLFSYRQTLGSLSPAVPRHWYGCGTLREFPGRHRVSLNKELLQVDPFKPPKIQQQAIQARLNYFLGAEEYDRLFVAFEILSIKNQVLTLGVLPACTSEVLDKYSWHVAIVAEALLKQAIRKVNVIPLDDSRPPQPQ